ncbi:tetratricopeptide repeat protein [Aristophania vespae]|uniref:tetratricopeptide repeat protein n=1 Tax=Aristophania vespae TaxID=2697033 RepID=UPI0023516554|nr:tetratricopeptide repeat protein [Aristophania vespae]UMM64782.1 hypothetical protein DM15PD_18020 [Aristophania vespae]
MKLASKEDIRKVKTVQDIIELCDPFLREGNAFAVNKIAIEVGLFNEDPTLILYASSLLSVYSSNHEAIITLIKKALLCLPRDENNEENNRALNLIRGEIEIRLAGALMKAQQEKEAMTLFMDIVRRYPELKVLVGEHLTGILLDAGRPKEAETILKAWLEEGLSSANIYNNMGIALKNLNRSAESLPYYRKALEIEPNNRSIAFSYGISLLKCGQYEEGLKYFVDHETFAADDLWWFLHDLPHLKQDDDVNNKHILFYQEQGLGDTLEFVRFLPALIARGAKITLAVPLAIKRLIQQSFPNIEVVLDKELAQEPTRQKEFDFSCPIPDLPHIYGIKKDEDIPAIVPYLRATKEDIEKFAKLIDSTLQENHSSEEKKRLRVGIVWGGDRRYKAADIAADKRRSTSFAEMTEALLPVEADIFNLQYDRKRVEVVSGASQPIYDLMDEVHDMADTAALMENLDLIISVDTSPLHLAGALGRPVWLVNRWDSCWRWGEHGETSVWYPTMKIFRSQELSFKPILAQVGEALRNLTKI